MSIRLRQLLPLTNTPAGYGGQAKAIASSTLWQVASQVTMAALSVATVKCVAVALSPEMAGYYNSSYGFLQLFGILADFGLYAVAVREVSRAQDKSGVLGDVITLRSIILVLSLSLALVIVFANPAWRGTPFPFAVLLAAAVPFFTLLAGTLRTVFQTEYRMKAVFVAEVSQRVLALSLIAAFVVIGVRNSTSTSHLFAFILAGGVGALLLFLISLFAARRLMLVHPRWNPLQLKKLFLLAAPYGLAFLCTALYRQLDITLIASLRDDFELQNAMYGFAQRSAEMAFLLPTILLNSTLPLLSKRHEAGEDTRGLLGKTLLAVIVIGMTAALFSFFWARPIMDLLTQDKYLSTPATPGSDTALMLLSPAMLLNALVIFSFYVLLTLHRWKPLVATLALGACVSIGLNLVLIPRYGFVGSGMTSIAVHVVLAILLLPQALRAMPAAFPLRSILQLAGIAIPLAAYLWLFASFLTGPLRTVGAGMLGLLLLVGLLKLTGTIPSMRERKDLG